MDRRGNNPTPEEAATRFRNDLITASSRLSRFRVRPQNSIVGVNRVVNPGEDLAEMESAATKLESLLFMRAVAYLGIKLNQASTSLPQGQTAEEALSKVRRETMREIAGIIRTEAQNAHGDSAQVTPLRLLERMRLHENAVPRGGIFFPGRILPTPDELEEVKKIFYQVDFAHGILETEGKRISLGPHEIEALKYMQSAQGKEVDFATLRAALPDVKENISVFFRSLARKCQKAGITSPLRMERAKKGRGYTYSLNRGAELKEESLKPAPAIVEKKAEKPAVETKEVEPEVKFDIEIMISEPEARKPYVRIKNNGKVLPLSKNAKALLIVLARQNEETDKRAKGISIHEAYRSFSFDPYDLVMNYAAFKTGYGNKSYRGRMESRITAGFLDCKGITRLNYF
jgi:hypothetical protein